MEDLVDLIATDSPASQVTDSIKELLFAKAAEKIDALRPGIADSMFGSGESNEDSEQEEE